MSDRAGTDRDALVPDAIVEAELVEQPARGQANECFGVPSRFGVGTLLVVTAAYGALLALLVTVGCNRALIVWLVVFISLVGTAQMLLFGSRRPREASLLAGAAGLPCFILLAPTIHGSGGTSANELACVFVSAVLFGAPAGYLAGGVVAGVFLIMDAVQRLLARLSEAEAEGDRGTDDGKDRENGRDL